MKSIRKRKSCMPATVSAGTKAKVTNQCPPDMTDSVKEALLQEIAEFNTDPAKKDSKANIAKKDAEVSANGGPNIDAYQEWLVHHDGHEPPEANPDIMSDEDGITYSTSKKDNTLVSLLTEFRQSLAGRELQVWNLVMKHRYSRREAAALLKLTPRVVDTYLKRARLKFKRFMESVK